MVKQKKGKKGKKRNKKAVGPAAYLLRDNYKIACKLMGERPDSTIMQQLDEVSEDGKANLNKIEFTDLDLGPSGARCVAEALLGGFPSMEGGPFLNLAVLRLVRCNVKDYGAVAIAKYLRNCPSVQLRLHTIDLFQNDLGVPAMLALGTAFSTGGNTTVKSLKLDYNPRIGTEGLITLCDGLMSNSTLETLNMECCNIGEDGGRVLAKLLSFSGSSLKHLKLMGNKMGTESVLFFALVLRRNRTLVELDLSDNGVGSSPPAQRDRQALWKLALALHGNDVFSKLKLDLNFIGEYASQLLLGFKEETGSLIPRAISNCMTSVHFAAGRPDIKEMFKANSAPSKRGKKGRKKKGKRKKKK